MPEEKEQPKKGRIVVGGYKPIKIKKGYQPTQGNLDGSNPPQGGSGVPPSSSDGSEKDDKQK